MSQQSNEFIQQATTALQGGQFAQALELIDKAIELEPSNGDAHVIRGICLAQTGQSDAATEAFRKSISINPNNPKGYYNLATHLYQLGQRAEAHSMASEALRLDPSHASARDLVQRIEQEEEAERAPQSGGLATPPPTGIGGGSPQQPQAPMGPVGPAGTGGTEGPGGPTPPPQGPYNQPPQAGSPYVRPGYSASEHNLAFVENMGGTWVNIGWGIVAVSLITFIIGLAMGGAALSEMFSDPNNMQQAMQEYQASLGAMGTLLQIVGYLLQFGALLWFILDVVDRRGNWLWLLLFLPCCCCGLHFIALPLYILLGRK